MENSQNKPLFVEFYGLPGCGKSTISHDVALSLRKKGKGVSEPSFDIDHIKNSTLRKVRKLVTTILWYVCHNGTFRRISEIVEDNNYSGISKIEQISNIIQKVKEYRKRRGCEVVMWDQGIVQAAISLSINGNKSSSENLKELYDIIPSGLHIMHILISIDSKTVIDRMAQRKSNDSRVEKLKDADEKEKMLQSFIDGISSIERIFECEKFDGKMDVDTLSNQVLERITCRF